MSEDNHDFVIHSVKYNFIMSSILKMSSFLFPLITFPYISRVLGPDGNGKISFATSVIFYFVTFSALGIPIYGIRACAQCRDKRDELSKTVQELLIIQIILSLLSYVILVVAIMIIPKLRENAVILFISSATLILSNIGVEWFYQAIEQYDYITFRNIGFKVISIILMFIFVKNPDDIFIYAGIQVFGSVGSNVLNIIRLKKYISFHWFYGYQIKRHLKPAVLFLMMTIAATIYTNLDTIMLGFMSNDTQVGYYNASVKMKNILVSVVAALGTVLLPRIAYYTENGLVEEYKKIISKSFKLVVLIALPLTTYCTLQSHSILLFLAGEAYLPASSAMIAIMPTILLIGLSNITGIQILIPLSREKHTIISTIAGALVDLLLNIVLIPRYGALGAAVGTLAAEFTVLIIQIAFLRTSIYLKMKYKDFVKIIISVLVAILTLLLSKKMVSMDNNFIIILFSSTVFFSVYGIMLLMMREDIVLEYGITYIKTKIKKRFRVGNKDGRKKEIW